MPRNEKSEFEILPSAERTATTTAKIALSQGVGMILFIDVTARDTTTTLTPKLTMNMPGVTDGVDIWTAGAAINSDDTTVAYLFYPGAGESSPAGYTEEKNKALPPTMTLTVTHSLSGSTNGITYSVYGVELP